MISRREMGVLSGEVVYAYRLANTSGAYVDISTLGGCLLSINVPDREGKLGDVTLGYQTIEEMRAASGYMGFLIGRYGNRIGGARFTLNGKEYILAKNNGENHLHGGIKGFNTKLWAAREQGDQLILSIVSADGEEGYPGELHVTVIYSWSEENALRIQYEAVSSEDTILNLTNHVYFNLSGPACPSIDDHFIQINADRFTEVASPACIPTGRLVPVDGTPFDLRTPRRIGEGLSHQQEDIQMQYGNGYDHNFVLRGYDGELREAVLIEDPSTGRRMEAWTDQPGVQFYTGNSIAGQTPGKCGVPYVFRQGFCLETQHFPDSIHHEGFPSCVLKKGNVFKTATEYRFSVK